MLCYHGRIMANHENVKNILLTVLLTSIVVVALIATTTALSLRTGVKSNVTPASVTPGYGAVVVPDGKSESPEGKIPALEPMVARSTSDYPSVALRGTDQANDLYWRNNLQDQQFSDWYLNTHTTFKNGIAYLTGHRTYHLSELALPASLFSGKWKASVDPSVAWDSFKFTRATVGEDIGGQLTLDIFGPYYAAKIAGEPTLATCADGTPEDVIRATSLLLYYYGNADLAKDNPCQYVSKSLLAGEVGAAWVPNQTPAATETAIYTLKYQLKPQVLDGRGNPGYYVQSHPAVIMSSKKRQVPPGGQWSLESNLQDIFMNQAFVLVEMAYNGGRVSVGESTLAEYQRAAADITTALSDSTAFSSCGYSNCF